MKRTALVSLAAGVLSLVYMAIFIALRGAQSPLAGARYVDSPFFIGILAMAAFCLGLDTIWKIVFPGDTPTKRRMAPTRRDGAAAAGMVLCALAFAVWVVVYTSLGF